MKQSSQVKGKKEFVLSMMDSLTAPIITFSQSWADTIPKRILDIIPQARLAATILNEEMATMPEVVAYVMTRTLEAPMDRDWVDIYTHCSCLVCEQYFKEDHWEAVSAPKELNEYQEKTLLNPLRRWIYKKRREVVKDRIKVANKAEKAAQKENMEIVEAQQLTLF